VPRQLPIRFGHVDGADRRPIVKHQQWKLGATGMFLTRRTNRVRAIAVGVLVAVAATVVPFVVPGASAASAAAKPTAGTIHLDIVNTSIEGRAPGDALITGAFADHGTEMGATRLSKGTITANIAKLNALFNSPKFATGYSASCSFSGVGDVALPIVSGTGAYAGITGNLSVHVIFGAQSPSKDQKCDGNAPPSADEQIITGSGKVSF
jgi:hypothetical protein